MGFNKGLCFKILWIDQLYFVKFNECLLKKSQKNPDNQSFEKTIIGI